MQTSASPGPASPVASIVDELRAAGITPTPLAVISMATDRRISDRELDALVAELAASRDLEGGHA